MPNLKCAKCGLANWPEADECLRCGFPLLRETPPVRKWYVAYCVFMALMYLFTIVIGFFFMFTNPSDLDVNEVNPKVMGVIFITIGVFLFATFAAGPFLPRETWAWIYGLVLICFGLTSVCCLPATIPLLIYWLKPETKEYFGRV